MTLPKPFRGIVTPLLTPLRTPDTVDKRSLRRLIGHVVAGGVNGIFILGTTGEGPALPRRSQEETIHAACEIAAGRVPVLVGVTHSCFADAVALAKASKAAGAAAVVTAGPVYFPVAQPQLEAFSRRFADASPLPAFIYNMPSHTHAFFEVATVAKLSGHKNIAGLKDSSGQIMYLQNCLAATAHREDFTLMVGPEEMMAECILGGIHGGVNGGSNLFPSLYVALYEAAARGDLEAIRPLRARVLDISRRIYTAGTYGSSYLQGIKCAASVLGLCSDVLAAPYDSFGEAEREKIAAHVRAIVAGSPAGA